MARARVPSIAGVGDGVLLLSELPHLALGMGLDFCAFAGINLLWCICHRLEINHSLALFP